MEEFKFTKLAEGSGKERLIVVGIILILVLMVAYRFSDKPDAITTTQVVIGLIILFFCGALLFKNIHTRLHAVGAWDITINDEYIHWFAPKGLGYSFDVRLADIEMFRITLDENDAFTSYELLLTDGRSIELANEVGMNFDEFTSALQKRGVEVDEIMESVFE